MAQLIINVVGTAAAICSMSSFVPQVIKLWRTKDGTSVSLDMYIVTVTGFCLWVAYGAMTKSWPVVVSNSVCLLLSAAILALKLKYKDRAAAASQTAKLS